MTENGNDVIISIRNGKEEIKCIAARLNRFAEQIDAEMEREAGFFCIDHK